MEKIKFKSGDAILNAEITMIKIGVLRIELEEYVEQNIILSGFDVMHEKNLISIGDYGSYTTLYRESDDDNVYLLSTGEIFEESSTDSTVSADDTVITEPTEEELQAQFESVKENKISFLSTECENAITDGVTVNGKNYAFTLQDQANLLNVINMSKESGLSAPYHADGETCSLYTYEQLMEIYIYEQMNLTSCQTYFNQMKLYIQSLTDRNNLDTVLNIVWGTELTGEYLVHYNEIMAQSQNIVATITSSGTEIE